MRIAHNAGRAAVLCLLVSIMCLAPRGADGQVGECPAFTLPDAEDLIRTPLYTNEGQCNTQATYDVVEDGVLGPKPFDVSRTSSGADAKWAHYVPPGGRDASEKALFLVLDIVELAIEDGRVLSDDETRQLTRLLAAIPDFPHGLDPLLGLKSAILARLDIAENPLNICADIRRNPQLPKYSKAKKGFCIGESVGMLGLVAVCQMGFDRNQDRYERGKVWVDELPRDQDWAKGRMYKCWDDGHRVDLKKMITDAELRYVCGRINPELEFPPDHQGFVCPTQ